MASSGTWQLPGLGSNSKLNTEIFSGFRYDTDANQAVETLAFGPANIVRPETQRKQADWSAVTKVTLGHNYAFSGRQERSWETRVEFSDQRFFHVSHSFDLTQVQADTGPRFAVAQVGTSTISVRPFGSFAWIGYGEKTYASLYGGGLSAQVRAPKWVAAMAGVGRFGSYEDSSSHPGTRAFTGPEFLISVSASATLDAATEVSASLSWYQADGRVSAFSRKGPAAGISATRTLSLLHRSAELIISGSVQQLSFGEPAPQEPAMARRQDTQWIGSSSLSIPLFHSRRSILGSTRAMVEYQYFRNASNVSPVIDHAFTVGIKATL